ncbi:MAG: DegT/DnrJ/EryC1/StrS family aminotransferase [Treponemataceae bacterium]
MSTLSDDFVPFAFPFIGIEEETAALRVLRSGWLTTGKEALAFEAEFASFLDQDGKKGLQAFAVNSATSGLHLALEACGVGPGDVVLTSPYTFTSTAEVARYLGADIAFSDTAEGSFNIDPIALERTLERLSKGLRAYPTRAPAPSAACRPASENDEGYGPKGKPSVVMPVHFAGLPCDMGAILTIARKYGVRVVEDSAHAFPSAIADGKWAGTLGDVGVFSFYATKTITTGEGGMVVSSDPEIASRVSVMRSHGIDRSVWNRYTDRKASWRYAVVEAGFKYNMPDILAAIGREQLKRASRLLEIRLGLAQRYDQAFGGDARFILPPTGPGDARHLYPIRLSASATVSRDSVIEALQNANIGVSVHFIPLHTMPYYETRYDLTPEDFPNAWKNFNVEISLPLWPGLSDAQQSRVIDALRSAVPERAT